MSTPVTMGNSYLPFSAAGQPESDEKSTKEPPQKSDEWVVLKNGRQIPRDWFKPHSARDGKSPEADAGGSVSASASVGNISFSASKRGSIPF